MALQRLESRLARAMAGCNAPDAPPRCAERRPGARPPLARSRPNEARQRSTAPESTPCPLPRMSRYPDASSPRPGLVPRTCADSRSAPASPAFPWETVCSTRRPGPISAACATMAKIRSGHGVPWRIRFRRKSVVITPLDGKRRAPWIERARQAASENAVRLPRHPYGHAAIHPQDVREAAGVIAMPVRKDDCVEVREVGSDRFGYSP
jgi:hypothetical protein